MLVVVAMLVTAVVVAPGAGPGAEAASSSAASGGTLPAALPTTTAAGPGASLPGASTVGTWPAPNPPGTTATAGTAGSAGTAAAGFGAADGKTLSIVPAGNNGMVTVGQLLQFETTGQRPPASQDQLVPYEQLPDAPGVAAANGAAAGGLTDASLSRYFFPETFALPANQVASVEHPSRRVPVTISWDVHGVPHIVGATGAAAAFGAGYAQAQTRLFEMDVLRHDGAGDLSSFLGPSCADEQMDQTQLLYSAATTAQEQAEIDALPAEFPTDHLGQQTLDWLRSYVAGVNAYVARTRSDPNLLPADYLAIGKLPTAWKLTDVAAIASLIGGQLGSGGGAGMANAGLWEYLDGRYGPSAATAIFSAFKEQNDPAAPSTIVDHAFPYMDRQPAGPTAANVLPDHPFAALAGAPTSTTPGCDLSVTSPQTLAPQLAPYVASLPAQAVNLVRSAIPTLQRAVRTLVTTVGQGLRFPTSDSNALVVDAAHTTSGHPLAVFGPQVAYWAPELLVQEVIEAPGIAADGVSFPGTGIVELGRGRDDAWSATSAGTQQIDTRIVTVCNPAGGAPAAEGTDYLLDGRCVPMREETFTETAAPTPGGLGLPTVITHHVFFADGGIVQGWTTAGGHPVAVVQARANYLHDMDSAVGFIAMNSSRDTTGVQAWMHEVSDITFTFNWFYVGPRHAGYYQSGWDPTPRRGVNANFPLAAGAATGWTGRLSFDAHPHQVDPPAGFFVSWNNKPAPGFSASDSQFGWGPVYRSQMLVHALQAELAAHHGRVDRAEVVAAMADAATEDLSALTAWPALAAADPHPADAHDAALLALLQRWVAAGAHRIQAAPGQGPYTDAAAVAVSDQLFPALTVALFGPIFAGDGVRTGPGGVPTGFDAFPQMGFVNAPGALGSAYDGGWEGNVQKLLDQLAGIPVAQPFPAAVLRHVCGPHGTASCPAAIHRALAATWQALVAANGGRSDPASWTADATSAAQGQPIPTLDQIHFTSVGVVGQPAIAWQNRPTFQQVAEFPRSRR